MLEIYHGSARYRNRLCIGAAAQAVQRDKNVLYVRFLRDAESDEKMSGRQTAGVILLDTDMPVVPGELSEEKRPAVSRMMREFFDKAVRMALTFKYEVLVLDRVFDAIDAGLLPESEVYEFLSDAPDRVEIICTGSEPGERFLALADESVLLTESRGSDK